MATRVDVQGNIAQAGSTQINNVTWNAGIENTLSKFATTQYETQKNFNRLRNPDTCNWVLNHPSFEQWRSSIRNDLLWVTADPGCGKSVLSRTVIEEKLVASPTSTICYFFFKDNEEQDNLATALCALLHQLFCKDSTLLHKYATEPIRKYGDLLATNTEELWRLFLSTAQDESLKEVVCILDALDECGPLHRNDLIAKIAAFYNRAEVVSNLKSCVKFFMTSRPYDEIEQQFEDHFLDMSTRMIRLAGENESAQISQEIGKFIDAEVQRLGRRRKLDDEVRLALRDNLSKVSHRTYLWVHLTLDELRKSLGSTKKKLLEVINTLPRTIEQAYEKILAGCQDRGEAKKLLQIILVARRPLTVAEIDVALEVHITPDACTDLDLQGVQNREASIRNACGLFVSIVDNRVLLIHETARSFLLHHDQETDLAQSQAWRHSIKLCQSELLMAEICAQYLLLYVVNPAANLPHGEKSDSADDNGDRSSLQEYSIRHWIQHALSVSTSDNSLLKKLTALCMTIDKLSPIGPQNLFVVALREAKQGLHPNSIRRLSFRHNSYIKRLKDGEANHDHRLEELLRQPKLFWALVFGLLQVVESLLSDFPEIDCVPKQKIQGATQNKAKYVPTVVSMIYVHEETNHPKIPTNIIMAALSNHISAGDLQSIRLAQRDNLVIITDNARRSYREDGIHAVSKVFLNRQDSPVNVTEQITLVKTRRSESDEALEILLSLRRGKMMRKMMYTTMERLLVDLIRSHNGCETLETLLDRSKNEPQTMGRFVVAAVQELEGCDAVRVLLDERLEEIKTTERIVISAVQCRYGNEALRVLLDQRRDEFEITEKILIGAIQNNEVPEILELLLERRGHGISFTEDHVIAAIGRTQIFKVMLDQRGHEIAITEQILIAAVHSGNLETLKILFDKRGQELAITERVIIAAIKGSNADGVVRMLIALLDLRGERAEVTADVVTAVMRLYKGQQSFRQLLSHRGGHEPFIEQIITDSILLRKDGVGLKELFEHLQVEPVVTTEILLRCPKMSKDLLYLLWRHLETSEPWCQDTSRQCSISSPQHLYYTISGELLAPLKELLESLNLRDFFWLRGRMAGFRADGWNYIHLKSTQSTLKMRSAEE